MSWGNEGAREERSREWKPPYFVPTKLPICKQLRNVRSGPTSELPYRNADFPDDSDPHQA